MPLFTHTSRCWMMPDSVRSARWKNIASGVKKICRIGSAMAAFDYKQAEEIRDTLNRHHVKYLFIGKSGAVLLGYPDMTQDADLFVEKNAPNCERLVKGLLELGFDLTDEEAQEVRRGKDFIQLKNGPFNLDLVFAPDGSNALRMLGKNMLRCMDSP